MTPLAPDQDRRGDGTARLRSPFTRPWFVLAAGFLVVAAILGVTVVLLPRARPPAAARPPAHHQPVTGGGTPAASGASTAGCHVPPGSQQVPAAAPAGVTWRLYQTVALPFSATAGPAEVAGDVARCYAHSPEGALLATVQIAVRYALAANWQAVLDQQVMPGAGRNVYASERPGLNMSARPGQYGQIAGFQFATYTPAVAVIQVVTQLPDGTLASTTMTVDWSDDDWRLVLQSDGAPGPNVQQLTSLTGFIAWSGV